MIYELDTIQPQFEDRGSVWIAPGAAVIGAVRLGAGVGIWFGAVLRGDGEPISIGRMTNLQEHVMVHTDPGFPVEVGDGCTIGHRAILHGCTIGDNTLIGMGAIVLNGAVIGNNCLVGAGALVTERRTFPDNSLIVGVPAKAIRTLSEAEIAGLKRSAEHYAANQQRFAKGLVPMADA
ncbi:MAG: gamma carbonic anhydrase family protein [Rhizobiaceae bacterium]|nr:gamma carbonic anhydrase family protein [Rhizobiaceae bacterium]